MLLTNTAIDVYTYVGLEAENDCIINVFNGRKDN